MEKKRIFIAIQYLEIGGAEQSLIGMLHALDYDKYDVDLFVYRHHGELMNSIPKTVRLLPEISSYAALTKPIKEIMRHGHVCVAMGRMLAKWRSKRFIKRSHAKESIAIFQYVADYVTPILPSLKRYGEYDLAISYLIPHNIVRDKVLARKKWAWIHTDYSFVEIDNVDELPAWSAYDRIAAVSEDVAKAFIEKFPELKEKVFVFENILSENEVRERASYAVEGDDLSLIKDFEGIRLCSVGRFSYPKAFDRAVEICKLLTKMGVKLRWYLIGYGGEEEKIRQAIRTHGMEEHFIILGKKVNPYPYINACDVYVQPSRYEGKAVTVREAQILCKPVVITEYATAHSQVAHGVDGVIVPNDVEGAAQGIFELIKDSGLRERIISYLEGHHYGNEGEVRIIDQVLGIAKKGENTKKCENIEC